MLRCRGSRGRAREWVCNWVRAWVHLLTGGAAWLCSKFAPLAAILLPVLTASFRNVEPNTPAQVSLVWVLGQFAGKYLSPASFFPPHPAPSAHVLRMLRSSGLLLLAPMHSFSSAPSDWSGTADEGTRALRPWGMPRLLPHACSRGP